MNCISPVSGIGDEALRRGVPSVALRKWGVNPDVVDRREGALESEIRTRFFERRREGVKISAGICSSACVIGCVGLIGETAVLLRLLGRTGCDGGSTGSAIAREVCEIADLKAVSHGE